MKRSSGWPRWHNVHWNDMHIIQCKDPFQCTYSLQQNKCKLLFSNNYSNMQWCSLLASINVFCDGVVAFNRFLVVISRYVCSSLVMVRLDVGSAFNTKPYDCVGSGVGWVDGMVIHVATVRLFLLACIHPSSLGPNARIRASHVTLARI